MKYSNHDPYGVLTTAKQLDPQKCKKLVERKLNIIRKQAGYTAPKRKVKSNFNQKVMSDLIKLYGKEKD